MYVYFGGKINVNHLLQMYMQGYTFARIELCLSLMPGLVYCLHVRVLHIYHCVRQTSLLSVLLFLLQIYDAYVQGILCTCL